MGGKIKSKIGDSMAESRKERKKKKANLYIEQGIRNKSGRKKSEGWGLDFAAWVEKPLNNKVIGVP